MTRRQFALGLTSGLFARAEAGRRSIPVALQLFSVRNQCAADLAGTLARVKEIGFSAVELAGDYGRTGAQFRRYLDDHGLACCGAHVSFDQLSDTKYQATLDFLLALGTKKAIIPGLPRQYTESIEGWRQAAGIFAKLSARLRRAGLELGYHNHAVEFTPLNGQRPLDVFLRAAPNEVFLELDLGGVGFGRANPVDVLNTYRRRVKMVHVKDYTASNPDVLIGSGLVDWPAFLREGAPSEIEWYVVEHASASGPDLSDIAESYARFKRLLDQSAQPTR